MNKYLVLLQTTGFLPHLTLKLIGIQFRKIGIYAFASEYSLGYDFSHLILLKCRLIYIHRLISWIFQLVEWISREIQVCFFSILNIERTFSLRFALSRFPFPVWIILMSHSLKIFSGWSTFLQLNNFAVLALSLY